MAIGNKYVICDNVFFFLSLQLFFSFTFIFLNKYPNWGIVDFRGPSTDASLPTNNIMENGLFG